MEDEVKKGQEHEFSISARSSPLFPMSHKPFIPLWSIDERQSPFVGTIVRTPHGVDRLQSLF